MKLHNWAGTLTAALVAAVATLAATAAGQEAAISLQRAMDLPVELETADAPIGEVFARLQAASGVRFEIDPDTLEYLPYGDQTRLAVTLRNVTLRQALGPMLAPQALQWEIEGDLVRIRPVESLYRMCRRATFEELSVLGKLHSVQLEPTDKAGPVIDQLRKAVGLPGLRLVFHVEAERAEAETRGERALPATGARWLDMLCHGKDWTWYLWGDNIILLPRLAQTKRQLERQVSLEYKNQPLTAVLWDLARKARVKLSMDPGVMNYLPANTRDNFNLIMADASIAQTLEVVSGATGLRFVTESDGIRVEASDALQGEIEAAAERMRDRPRFFVRLSIPGPQGMTIDVLMRPEELPEDVLKLIEKQKDRLIENLRAGQGDGE